MPRLACVMCCLLLVAPACFSQDPLPVLKSGWHPAVIKPQKAETPPTGPTRGLTVNDTLFARNSREARTDNPDNPADVTPDGRRAAIERNVQQAKTAQQTDVNGFTYTATVKNDSAKTVQVIYWEYLFTELANPSNVVRRQFLCSVNLKKGAQIELSAFSTFGPTDTISAATLASSKDKLFDEKVQINRIEYADDDVMQRGNWKLADVKTAVTRATATPWGKELCRPL